MNEERRIQLVTIAPDGSIETLQPKKGKGLDLRQLGAVSIERITSIHWSGAHQRWGIQFLLGEWKEHFLTLDLADSVGVAIQCESTPEFGICLFKDYDEAVSVEIAVVEAARRRGMFAEVGSANQSE